MENITKILHAIHQEQLLKDYSSLTDQEKKNLSEEIKKINLDTFEQQKKALLSPFPASFQKVNPVDSYSTIGNENDQLRGHQLLSEGRVGCLIVAGGQGTRLGSPNPKGFFPITPIHKKSLFQLFAEKTSAASRQANRDLKLAIMTSPLNHEVTCHYFKENDYFGLNPQQIDFFSQEMLPFLNEEGNLFLESVDHIAQGPDGNGLSLHHFWKSGIGKKWAEAGVEYVNYILVDNPLADPFDAELFGFHVREGNEITIKCIKRTDPEEKVGVLVSINDHLHVIEYTEMPEKDKKSTKYQLANLSLFCFNLSFIKNIVENGIEIPLHSAKKAAKSLDKGKIMTWKFEYFIFDVLPLASKVKLLVYPRELCFAPLKNLQGENSVETVQQALQNLDRITLAKISGKNLPTEPFELPQEFYYPTPDFLNKWNNSPLSSLARFWGNPP